MPAAITDLLSKASNGTAPVATTLASQKSNGAVSASISLATGWPTTTAVHGLLYKVDANNKFVPGTLLVWKGTLSGTTVSNFTVKSGTDDVYAAGSVIQLAFTSAQLDDLITALLVDHTQLGYHSSLHDANGAIWIGQTAIASAVNYVNATNAITGTGPILSPAGSDSNIDLNINPKGTGVIKVNGSVPRAMFQNAMFNFVESGCVITGDSLGTNKNYSMTAGFVWIAGKRLSVAAVSAQTVGASKDRYIDYQDNGDGTAVPTTTEVTNNAASPAIANSQTEPNNVRIGIVVAGATTIANAASINQGQETMVLPIASSIPYAVTDSLGNLICPRDPNRKILGYKQVTSGSSQAALAQVTGLSAPILIPAGGRKVKISFQAGPTVSLDTNASNSRISIWDGTVGSGTQLQEAGFSTAAASQGTSPIVSALVTLSAGLHTINIGGRVIGSGTQTVNSAATTPAYVMVELA